MENDATIIAEILEEGLDDWVSLNSLVWFATRGVLDDETRARTLRILGRLYDEKLMVPGDLGESGFEVWSSPREIWLERSKVELDNVAWVPVGAGFWLCTTDQGEALARSVESS